MWADRQGAKKRRSLLFILWRRVWQVLIYSYTFWGLLTKGEFLIKNRQKSVQQNLSTLLSIRYGRKVQSVSMKKACITDPEGFKSRGGVAVLSPVFTGIRAVFPVLMPVNAWKLKKQPSEGLPLSCVKPKIGEIGEATKRQNPETAKKVKWKR